VHGTTNVLNAVNKADSVRRVVLTSSCAAVYGNHDDKPRELQPYTEEDWNRSSTESVSRQLAAAPSSQVPPLHPSTPPHLFSSNFSHPGGRLLSLEAPGRGKSLGDEQGKASCGTRPDLRAMTTTSSDRARTFSRHTSFGQAQNRWSLVTINPAFVLGPNMSGNPGASLDILKVSKQLTKADLLTSYASIPACPTPSHRAPHSTHLIPHHHIATHGWYTEERRHWPAHGLR
jgi:3',5'-cyclic AMP phosphodiesterase CpdA